MNLFDCLPNDPSLEEKELSSTASACCEVAVNYWDPQPDCAMRVSHQVDPEDI